MSDNTPSFMECAGSPLYAELEKRDDGETGSGRNVILKGSRATSNAEYRIIFFLLFLTQFWTLVMTFIPVIGNVQPKDYYDRKGWSYGGTDVMRFLEPVISLPLNFALFCLSGILIDYDIRDPMKEKEKTFFIGLWFLAAAICQQGAGFHSCANMLKNAFETLPIYSNPVDDGTQEFYYYIRTWWQHLISHYMYAAGYAFMAISNMFAYRQHATPGEEMGGLSKENQFYLVISAFCYGLVTSGVAINFPAGTVVALVYLLCYGIFGLIGYRYYLSSRDRWYGFELFTRPVLDYYILSYTFSLIIVLIWIGYAGSVWKTREDMEH